MFPVNYTNCNVDTRPISSLLDNPIDLGLNDFDDKLWIAFSQKLIIILDVPLPVSLIDLSISFACEADFSVNSACFW